jgi:hypothetical protein
MSETFERIMDLGRQEAAHIAAEDTDGLAAVLSAREEAIHAFVEAGPGGNPEVFLDKLTRLQGLNARLRHEAKALHQTLKEELLRVRSERHRLGWYRESAVITPLDNRLVSRRG